MCFLASADRLSFNSPSPSTFTSVIHFAETVSWLSDVVVRFCLESVFCYYACCNRLPTLGQLFLIIFFHLGCLLHRTYITPHHQTWTYTHSLLSPLAETRTLPGHRGSLELLCWKQALRQMVRRGDAGTNHQPLDLDGPSFSPCTV